ncbi:MAG: DUF2723 domain-containing protein [Candidatus Roizmanbacteria bacterium]|nr:MAG: DUF2723 domain-containing protein [Candidatus Roizmanbacteria bacterium]
MIKKSLGYIVLLIVGFIHIGLQSKSIVGGDGGDLVASAFINGIPHAPGYPLYTFLGSLLLKLELVTPAWLMNFLSSIPAILQRLILFFLIYKLSKSYLHSFSGVLIYSFLYPSWLFAEIPEIQSLSMLFLTGIFYLVVLFEQTKKKVYLYFLAAVFGFAFFHNYLVMLVIPSVFVYLKIKKNIILIKDNYKTLVILFFTGLLPYLYAIFASLRYPPIDNNHAASLDGFVSLATRASYGSFRLSNDIYFNINNAYLSVLNLFNFIRIDFKIIGIILMALGFFYLRKNNKKLFLFLIINLVSIIIFFAYASFPTTLPLHWGIFEKYLLVPYFYLTILVVFGFLFLFKKIPEIITNPFLQKTSLLVVVIAAFFYPVILFSNNYKRIYVLKNDFTAENLGKDLLNSVPKDGILNLNDDTGYYNTIYSQYALKVRPDVKIVMFGKLKDKYYREYLVRNYPEIYLPDVEKLGEDFGYKFLEENSRKFAILSSKPTLKPEVWLPHGLLWRYYPSYQKLPEPNQLISQNFILWKKYHSPLAGSLSRYQTLLLSDVLRIYAFGHQSFGMMLYRNKQYRLAENEYKVALNYLPEAIDNHINLTKTYIDSNQCSKAETVLNQAEKFFKKDKKIYKNYIDLYANCFKDEEKASGYIKIFEKLKEESSLL